MATDGIHQLIEDRFDSEDFFLTNAQQVVVVGRSGDDRPGSVIDVSSFVDNDWRVARTSDDRSFVAGQSCSRDLRSTGHAQQFHTTVLEDFIS